jgi:catechol 2,3-dioxygenase-like lactoylglutathione lyase family enzyme
VISEVHHVALGVRDLARSIAFYRDLLGFKVSLEIRADDAEQNARLLETPPGTRMRSAMLRKAHSTVGQIELIQFDPPLPDACGPARAGDHGPFLLSFEVSGEELDAIRQRLETRGVRCHGKPEAVDIAGYGRIGALVFRDPDGVLLELVALPPTR